MGAELPQSESACRCPRRGGQTSYFLIWVIVGIQMPTVDSTAHDLVPAVSQEIASGTPHEFEPEVITRFSVYSNVDC